MGRLIDADKLIEAIRKSTCQWSEHMWKQVVCDVINNQPTAYDVEKVVEELEKLKQHNKELSEGAYLEDDKSFYFCAYTNFARAIDIAKRGGVE